MGNIVRALTARAAPAIVLSGSATKSSGRQGP